jgi:hypothetical protein
MGYPTGGPATRVNWLPAAATAADLRALLSGESVDLDASSDNVIGGYRRTFPGGGSILPARGKGATALTDADRSATIIYQVTNTNATGAGSLKQAFDDASNEPNQDALKIIIFRTGGYISLSSNERIWVPLAERPATDLRRLRNVYIAGQTAPGDGICLRASPNTTGTRLIEFHYDIQDIVWRGVRFRYGFYEGADSGDQNLMFRQWQRLVIDSCTFSWAPGRNIEITVQRLGRSALGMHDSTQNCMFYEAFSPHRTAVSGIGNDQDDNVNYGDVTGVSTGHSFHMNLMASAERRCPNMGQYAEVINNIAWNINDDSGWIGPSLFHDHIANIIYDGPMKKSTYVPFGILSDGLFDATYGATSLYVGMGGPSIMAEQNLWLARPGTANPDIVDSITTDNWSTALTTRSGVAGEASDRGMVGGFKAHAASMDAALAAGTDGFTGILEFRRNKRLWDIGPGDREWNVCQHTGWPVFPVPVQNPTVVDPIIRANAGVAWRVNESGEWVRDRRDADDARIISELSSGNPTVTSASSHLTGTKAAMDARFPYDTLAAGSAPTDTNGDGIPDAFYTKWGYDHTATNVHQTIAADGYCLAEHYINGTSPVDASIQFATGYS